MSDLLPILQLPDQARGAQGAPRSAALDRIRGALRHALTVIVFVLAVVLADVTGVPTHRIFPKLDVPVVYVAQP